jgi:Leucine-rich repeat (LRR) protein
VPAGEGTVLERWLSEVDTQFKAMFDRDAEKPFQAAMTEARKTFLQALDSSASSAFQGNRPNEGQTLRAEIDKFLAAKEMVPVEDTDNPIETIRIARAKFRVSVTAAYKDRLAHALPVFQKYESVLSQNTSILLQRHMRTEANRLSAKRSEITRSWISQTSPFLDDQSVKIPASNRPRALESAVDWLLRSGGRLTLQEGRKSVPLISAKDLPKNRPDFEELSFTGKKLSKKLNDEDFVELSGLGSVRSVKFLGVPAGTAAFLFLRGWKSLESLTIDTAMVTDQLADNLLQLPHLKSLSLENCRGITPQFLNFLQGALPSLETLSLSGTNMSDDCFQFLGKFPRLTNLSLNQTEVTDSGLALLTSMHGLRQLSVIGTQVTLDGLSKLSELKLETLGFLSTDMPDFGPVAETIAARLPKVTGLVIGGTEIDVENIEALKVFRPLKSLNLLNNAVDAPSIEVLAKLHGLESLSSTSRTVNDWCLAPLQEVRELKSLTISNARISNGGLMQLRNCRKLRFVDVTNSSVTDSGAELLERAAAGMVVLH